MARTSYRVIAHQLETQIRSGESPPGSKLPSYGDLAALYGVSVTTAQSAIRELRAQGLVRGDPGVGVFVVDELPSPPSSSGG